MSSYLRAAVERAGERLRYCRRRREAYQAYNHGSEQPQRTLHKLLEDGKRAQLDYALDTTSKAWRTKGIRSHH